MVELVYKFKFILSTILTAPMEQYKHNEVIATTPSITFFQSEGARQGTYLSRAISIDIDVNRTYEL